MPDIVALRHLQHHVSDRLAGEKAPAGVLLRGQGVPVAVTQRETGLIGGEIGAEVIKMFGTMHRQRRCIGVGQRSVGFDHDDAVVQLGNDAE